MNNTQAIKLLTLTLDIMKRSKLFILLFIGIYAFSFGQESNNPVEKGDYKILKFDALNLMGIGVQKFHLGFEVSPMNQNANNLPTIQFNLYVPFNSLNEDVEVANGIEGGVELRFYQRRKNKASLAAEGFYMGVAMDGRLANFSLRDRYFKDNFSLPGETEIIQFNEYQRIRTGIAYLLGGQTKLGDKLYFDGNIGIGWSNVNVQAQSNDADIPNYIRIEENLNPLFLHFEKGKGQRFYVPLSVSLGYNFGRK